MKLSRFSLPPLLLSLLLMAGAAFAAAAAEKVNINTADAAQLEAAMVGIGSSKAEAIVAHRTASGPFKSVDELVLVKGIGLKTVERNRDLITIGPAAKPAASPASAPAARPASVPATPVARR